MDVRTRSQGVLLHSAIEKLKTLQPVDWLIEVELSLPERGNDPLAYSSKISWQSPTGVVVMMQHLPSHPTSEYSREEATIEIIQTYGDGSPPDNVFSGKFSAFAHGHDDQGGVVPVFEPLANFILGVTDAARRARAQRCIEARRTFFGS